MIPSMRVFELKEMTLGWIFRSDKDPGRDRQGRADDHVRNCTGSLSGLVRWNWFPNKNLEGISWQYLSPEK